MSDLHRGIRKLAPNVVPRLPIPKPRTAPARFTPGMPNVMVTIGSDGQQVEMTAEEYAQYLEYGPEYRDVIPATIIEILEPGHRYRVFTAAGYFEMFTYPNSASTLKVGDLVFPRFVKPNSQQLFLPEARGIPPVMIAASINITGSSDNPLRFGYTMNILAPSPVWVENSVGLPSNSAGALHLFGDGATEYITERTPTGGPTDDRMWRNVDPLGTGVWQLVLDQSMINALLGTTYTTTILHAPIARVTSDGSSIVYAIIETEVTQKDYVAHSHNDGTTWTIIELPDGTNRNYYSMAVGFANTDLVYVCGARDIPENRETITRSLDGGHTFSIREEIIPQVTAAFIGMPKSSNPLEEIVFVGRGPITAPRPLIRSTDGGDTFSAWGANHKPLFSPTNALSMWNASNNVVYRSIDQGLSYTFVNVGIGGPFPYSIQDAILHKDNLMVISGRRAITGGVITGPAIWSSPDKITFTGRDGNLDTAIYYNLQVSQRPFPLIDFYTVAKPQHLFQ